MPVLIAITVVLAICTILNFVMMLKATNETSSEVPTNTSIYTEKEDYIESLVSYFNEQEEMEFMIYLYNNYPEIFYDILSFYL